MPIDPRPHEAPPLIEALAEFAERDTDNPEEEK